MFMSTGTVLRTPVTSTSWIHDLAQYRALERYGPKGCRWHSCFATERGNTATELYNDDDDDAVIVAAAFFLKYFEIITSKIPVLLSGLAFAHGQLQCAEKRGKTFQTSTRATCRDQSVAARPVR